MQPPITGGCLCGAVRYRCEAAPLLTVICCCRQCQRLTGSGHAPQAALPSDRMRIEGALRHFELTAESGSKLTSSFCGICGSPIAKRTTGYPELVMVYAASLDEPADFTPERVVWESARQPWDHLDPRLLGAGS